MDNKKYVESLGIDKEAQNRCLAAMEKYGDNRWWEPDVDPRKLAYYQIHEPIILGSFSDFHEAIELLLGRPVFTHEFIGEKLKQEAERAWKYQVAVTSDTERRERVQEAIESLEQWAEQNDKQIIHIQLPDED